MPLTTAQIQNAYVAFFNRPADVAGLAYWGAYAGSGGDLLNTFAQSSEYKSLYANMNNTQLINAVYLNLFGHEPEIAGLNYWVALLDQGKLTLGNVADAVNKGAQGNDATIIANKVAAATAFTGALDTNAEILAYAAMNSTALGAVKSWLSAVKADAATLTSATSAATLSGLTATVQNNLGGGGTYVLTSNIDRLAGGTSNDVFIADNSGASKFLVSADQIDGGAGVDTLKIYSAAADALDALYLGSLSNIEVLQFEKGTLTNGNSLDLSYLPSITAATVSNPVALADSAVFTFKSIASQSLTLSKVLGTTGGATSTVKLDGGSGVTLNGVGTDVTLDVATVSSSFAVNASGSGSTVALTNSGGQLSALSVGGDKSLSLSVAALPGLKTVNASANSGGVTLDQTADNQLSFTGGSGNDTAKFAAGQFTVQDSVDLGAGSGDKLLLADTSVSVALKAAVNSVKGIEILGFSGAGISADVSTFVGSGTAGIKSFSVEAAGAVAFSESAGGTSYSVAKSVNNSASTFSVTNSVGESATTLTLAGGVKTGTTTFAGISTINVVSSGSTANLLGKETGATTTTDLVHQDNVKFVITGSQDLEMDNLKATGTGSAIDAGAFTGKLTAIGSIKADTLKGGGGADSLQVGSAAAGGLVGQADVLTGGAGNDTFKFAETFDTDKATSFAAFLKQSAGTAGIVKVTDFVAGADKLSFSTWGAGSAAQDIGTGMTLVAAQTLTTAADLAAVYAGIGAIAASVAGGGLNGVVLTVSAGAAAGTYLYINDATAGVSAADDMLINITGLSGTLSASDFIFA